MLGTLMASRMMSNFYFFWFLLKRIKHFKINTCKRKNKVSNIISYFVSLLLDHLIFLTFKLMLHGISKILVTLRESVSKITVAKLCNTQNSSSFSRARTSASRLVLTPKPNEAAYMNSPSQSLT